MATLNKSYKKLSPTKILICLTFSNLLTMASNVPAYADRDHGGYYESDHDWRGHECNTRHYWHGRRELLVQSTPSG
jgi:hypothetical protein